LLEQSRTVEDRSEPVRAALPCCFTKQTASPSVKISPQYRQLRIKK
jgi:hypothetical protein